MKVLVVLLAVLFTAESSFYPPLGQKTYDKIVSALQESPGITQPQMAAIRISLTKKLSGDLVKQLNLAIPVSTITAAMIREVGAAMLNEVSITTTVQDLTMERFLFNLEARTPKGIAGLEIIINALNAEPGLTVPQQKKITDAVNTLSVTIFGFPQMIVPISTTLSAARLRAVGAKIIQAAKSNIAITQKIASDFVYAANNAATVQTIDTFSTALGTLSNDTKNAILQLESFSAMEHTFTKFAVIQTVHKTPIAKIQQLGQPLLNKINQGHDPSIMAQYFVDKLIGRKRVNAAGHATTSVLIVTVGMVMTMIF